MSECSGEVISYPGGYRCDAYAPTALMWIIIFIGIASFFGAILSFLFSLTARRK